MSQINLKQLLTGDGQQEYIDKLNFNFGQIIQFGGGPPGSIGNPGVKGFPGGRGPIGLDGQIGLRGSMWTVIDSDPTIINLPHALVNDLAFNRFTGHLFEFNGTLWQDEGKLIEDGTFTERNGAVFYNLPLHEGVIKSLVLSPTDYKTLNVDPLTSTFRPVVKLLSNNLANPFLVIGAIDGQGLESPQTKQIGFYLDNIGNGSSYDFTISNSAGDNIFEAGPNHFKIGKDNTYKFTAAGIYNRLTLDLSSLTDRYLIFNGDGDGTTKFHIGWDKNYPSMVFDDLKNVGINVDVPLAKFHVNADDVNFVLNSRKIGQITSANVGGGNLTKLVTEFTRIVQGVDGFETDSIQSSITRLDGNARGGFIAFNGGNTNKIPQISLGFQDVAVVKIDKTSLTVTGDVAANNSGTIGSRKGLIGTESFTVGNEAEASSHGSIAIGGNTTSNHANAVVIGSGNSKKADSIFLNNPTSTKTGAGSYDVTIDYFQSQNPKAIDDNGSQRNVTSSVQHDGTTEGFEIVSYRTADSAYGLSFLVTQANLDGSKPTNLFSVGKLGIEANGPLSIGITPLKSTDLNISADPSYCDLNYSLSVDGTIIMNPVSHGDHMLIASSTFTSSSLFPNKSVDFKRGSLIIKGGDLVSLDNKVAKGGDVVIVPGIGTNTLDKQPYAGSVILAYFGSIKTGDVLIGKNTTNGVDALQVIGGAYFESQNRVGSTAIGAVQQPLEQLQSSTAFSGYVSSASGINRVLIENSFTTVGKIGHTWNSISFSPDIDVHTTYEAGLVGIVSDLQNVSSTTGYAAYFDDQRVAQGYGKPTIVINNKDVTGTSIAATGQINSSSTMSAYEFKPGRGWVTVPFSFLKIQAFKSILPVSPAFGLPGGVVFVTDPFALGNTQGQQVTSSIKAFRYGSMVHMSFHFTIRIDASNMSGVPDNYLIEGFPFTIRGATFGTCFAQGITNPNSAGQTFEVADIIPVISRAVDKIQIQLPRNGTGDTPWGNCRDLNISGMIILNAELNDFSSPPPNISNSSFGAILNVGV